MEKENEVRFSLLILLSEDWIMTKSNQNVATHQGDHAPAFEPTEHCNQLKPFVIEANEQNLDRLEAELRCRRSKRKSRWKLYKRPIL